MTRDEAIRALNEEVGRRLAKLFDRMCDELTEASLAEEDPQISRRLQQAVLTKFRAGVGVLVEASAHADEVVDGITFGDQAPASGEVGEDIEAFRARLLTLVPTSSVHYKKIRDEKDLLKLEEIGGFYGIERGKGFVEKREAS